MRLGTAPKAKPLPQIVSPIHRAGLSYTGKGGVHPGCWGGLDWFLALSGHPVSAQTLRSDKT